MSATKSRESDCKAAGQAAIRLLGFFSPKGYRYEAVEGHGKLLVQDDVNAPIIRSAFEMFSSGELLNLTDVANFFCDSGLLNRSGKRITPSLSECRRILTRKLYIGVIDHEPWGIRDVEGHHEAIVEKSLFSAVQQRLAGRRRAPNKSDLAADFPLRGYVLCAGCGTHLTAS